MHTGGRIFPCGVLAFSSLARDGPVFRDNGGMTVKDECYQFRVFQDTALRHSMRSISLYLRKGSWSVRNIAKHLTYRVTNTDALRSAVTRFVK